MSIPYKPSPFIQSIIDIYHNNGLVGEERNIIKVFLAAVSKYLPDRYRLHIIVISESGAGKTTLLKSVLEPFNDDVKKYSRFTGSGLERSASLDGKILLYEQMNGMEAGQLKILMSEGELTILLSERDDHGKFVPMEYSLKGMPVFMTTSTKPDLDVEMLNRALLLSIDESESQTKRILERQALEFETINEEDSFKKWSAISRLQSIYEDIRKETIAGIKCPFASQSLKDLPLPLNIRRDFLRLLNLTAIIAYAKMMDPKTNEYRRPVIELSNVKGVSKKIIVAVPEDFNDALWCLGEGLIESFYHFVGKAKEIYQVLCNNKSTGSLDDNDILPSTARDVGRKVGLGQKRAYKYLEALVDAGLATKLKEGNTNFYYPEIKTVSQGTLDIKFNEDDFTKWVKQQFPNKEPKILDNTAFNEKTSGGVVDINGTSSISKEKNEDSPPFDLKHYENPIKQATASQDKSLKENSKS